MSKDVNRFVASMSAHHAPANGKTPIIGASLQYTESRVARTLGELLRHHQQDPIAMRRAAQAAGGGRLSRGNFFDRNRRPLLEGLFGRNLGETVTKAYCLDLPDGRVWTVDENLRAWRVAGTKYEWESGECVETLLYHAQQTRPGGLEGILELEYLLGPAFLAAIGGRE
jgi:hypothetical protein